MIDVWTADIVEQPRWSGAVLLSSNRPVVRPHNVRSVRAPYPSSRARIALRISGSDDRDRYLETRKSDCFDDSEISDRMGHQRRCVAMCTDHRRLRRSAVAVELFEQQFGI